VEGGGGTLRLRKRTRGLRGGKRRKKSGRAGTCKCIVIRKKGPLRLGDRQRGEGYKREERTPALQKGSSRGMWNEDAETKGKERPSKVY